MIEEVYIAAYQKDYDAVVRYVYSLGHNPEIAEDIAQSAWLKAWEKRETFRGDCTVKTWVCLIARHKLIMYLRKYDNRPNVNQLTPDCNKRTFLPDYDTPLAVEQMMNWIRPAERGVLLDWSRGYTYDELAGGLGLSPGGAKTRISRIKASMRLQYAA
jgi:RNA polymerase sigma factor (sigma-70 family)